MKIEARHLLHYFQYTVVKYVPCILLVLHCHKHLLCSKVMYQLDTKIQRGAN
jgi:hypothetical protein